MPTYEYVCRECGHHLEVVQKFTDDPLQTCERCQGRLRKVFSAAGIIFKGSGYYVTDTRSSNGKSAARANGSSGSDSSSDTADSSSSGGSSSDGASSDGASSGGSKDSSSGSSATDSQSKSA